MVVHNPKVKNVTQETPSKNLDLQPVKSPQAFTSFLLQDSTSRGTTSRTTSLRRSGKHPNHSNSGTSDQSFLKKEYIVADKKQLESKKPPPQANIFVSQTRRDVKTDLNPLHIDEVIRNHLLQRQSSLDELEKQLEEVSSVAAGSLSKPLPSLNDKMIDVMMSFELGYYMYRTHDIISEYRELERKRHTSFVAEKQSKADAMKTARRKSELLFQYLEVADKFIDLTMFPGYGDYFNAILDTTCSSCGAATLNIVDENTFVCSCGAEVEQLDMSPLYTDGERLNSGYRFPYSCWGHFLDAMNNYEGVEKLNVDDKKMEKILREMACQHITRDSLTKDQLYLILTENKMIDLYDHINNLHSRITGKPCPSISEHRTQLAKLFKELESVYPEVEDEDRSNSRHVNFKLYKCLQFLGHRCYKDDFYMLRTAGKLEDHEEVWVRWVAKLQERYPKTGWKYIPTR